MNGRLLWRFESYTQLGDTGFFGRYDSDSGLPNPGAAGPVNFWIGRRLAVNGPLVSGSDASLQTMYMEVDPQITFNRAVRVNGRYRIGSWVKDTPAEGEGVAQLHRSEYMNNSSHGVQTSFSPGYWTMLWITVRMPWGIITAGKRPHSSGTGLMYDGTDNHSTESLSLQVPYGPFRLGLSFYPWRVGSREYWNRADRSGMRNVHATCSLLYRTGSTEIGAKYTFLNFAGGPESQLDPAERGAVIPMERADDYGIVYIKHDNGSTFFNSEFSFYRRMDTHHPSVNAPAVIPGSGSPFKPDYIEHGRFMVDCGVYQGHAKLSLLVAWISGPDRRHGVLIDRTGELRTTSLTNSSVFMPYSRMLVYNYGGGNGSFSDAENGYLTDAAAFGARLDWALAANLNFYFSFFHAERVSHGYGWGYIRPVLDANIPTGQVEYARQGDYVSPAPAIPDSDLGYEFNWGLYWQLLENFGIAARIGLWQPGKWFKYACVDRSNSGWKTPNASNGFGANPARAIDPVFYMEVTLAGWF